MRITLSGGNWAQLRDPESFRQRDRKALLLGMDAVEGGDLARGLAVMDKVLALLVESWSYELPVPSVDEASLEELSIADYDALSKACEATRKVMFPDFSPDPTSVPTEPSAA
jgi:hypothetical protein